VLLTRELAESIRFAEIAGIRSGVEAVTRLRPDACATSTDVAGGLVAFFGRNSPLSEAFGVGTLAPVTSDQITAITEFYESRDATPRVFVSPLAHSTLTFGLAAAGYAPTEYENVLATEDFERHARRDDSIRIAANVHAWARASTAAFMDRADYGPDDEFFALGIASSEGVCALEAAQNGAIAATAAMDIRGDWSALFAGSTMPAFRRRGWHVAMIADRMARAHEAGARFLRATARPASTSERNLHRCGFVTLYTRALWERTTHRDLPNPSHHRRCPGRH
jgi:hypothetical protein